MRIGLLRHFPVQQALPYGWLNAEHLDQWRMRYDDSEVTSSPLDVSAHAWGRCYSSDLRRAYLTAQAAFSGEIIQSPLLREAEILKFRTGRLLLPAWAWRWTLRLAWLTAHPSQRPARDAFLERVKKVAQMLEAEQEDTLVVSHAGMMMFLRKELIRRGFRGPKFRIAENAKLYVFER